MHLYIYYTTIEHAGSNIMSRILHRQPRPESRPEIDFEVRDDPDCREAIILQTAELPVSKQSNLTSHICNFLRSQK